MPGQERGRDAEGGHLGEGEIDEDHAAGEHVEPQVDVDARQHEAGEKGQPQQFQHQRPEKASTRRLTSRSMRPT